MASLSASDNPYQDPTESFTPNNPQEDQVHNQDVIKCKEDGWCSEDGVVFSLIGLTGLSRNAN